jgi:hypothetical protein
MPKLPLLLPAVLDLTFQAAATLEENVALVHGADPQPRATAEHCSRQKPILPT